MKRTLAIIFAVAFHLGVILFGGILFLNEKKDQGTTRQVDLVTKDSEDKAKKKEEEKPKETPEQKKEEMEADKEKPPDAAEIVRNMRPRRSGRPGPGGRKPQPPSRRR